MAKTADGRAFVAGKFAIDMGGNFAGWVQSVEGGQASADVVSEKMGPDQIVRKHIAGVKYEDISLTCGTGMSKAFYKWIKDSFDHNYSRKDGAIIAADYNAKEVSRMSFYHALISEIGFPALDAASKDAAKLSLKFHPETTRTTTSFAGGSAITGTFDAKVQKKWMPSNFRLSIDGLSDACSRVSKIEALVIKQKNVEHSVGQMRDYEQEPASLEIPNLVITFPESHADDFYKWHEDFVIKGENGSDKEKGGTLEYLTPNLQETLFTLTFQHLGIFKLTPDKVEAGSENIRRVKAEMYCEELILDIKSAWA
jgi:phage tail-like protein